MSAPAIFVSHSHQDDEYCHTFVASLRAAGLDVWYDEHNATSGHLRTLIERELRQRPIFIVVLSPAALKSQWVSDECDWAYSLYRKEQARRVILPVLAETVDEDAIWLFMQQFKRIEQPGLIPWPVAEAARRTTLAVSPNATINVIPTVLSPSNQPDEVDSLLARANALASQGKRVAAIEVLRQATALAPRSVAAWNALGFNLDWLNLTSEALEAFEHALLLDPNNAFACAGKANALSLDYPQKAIEYADKALVMDARSVLAFNGKGVALVRLHRFQESLDIFTHAIVLDSTFAHLWSGKGNALLNLGRYQEALDAYNRAVDIEPSAIKWWGKGYALYHLNRYQEALDAHSRAIELDPNYVDAWDGKGAALRSLGRHQEALDAYDRAIALDPDNANAWNGKGNTLYNLNHYQEALDAYDRVIALDPNDASVWNDKGNVFFSLKRFQEAVDAYDRNLALIPNNVIVWQNKANALRRLGRTAEADAAERKVKELEKKQ
ncbi:MAG: tetratricopeptide repeat protein [Chloroflexota bacterium]|nr:tetratricopeptide repeat protein [Chloroflexota bacterium]